MSQSSKLGFIIQSKHSISWRTFSNYIGHNVYYYFTDEKAKYCDTNIVNLENLTNDNHLNNMSIISYSIKKSKTNLDIKIENGEFIIEYIIKNNTNTIKQDNDNLDDNDNLEQDLHLKYKVICYRDDCKGYFNFTEENATSSISFTPLDDVSYNNFGTFTKEIHNFTKKYIYNMSNNDNDITIYVNDQAYWDELNSKSPRPLNTVYLPKTTKDIMVNDIEWFLDEDTKTRFTELGRTHKRVYLFEGVPGSGKTTFISSLASYFGYNVAIISFTDKVSDGGLLRLIRTLPERTFLVLEDVDCLFEERKKNDTVKNYVSFSGILNALDGLATPTNFICFMTTNYKCNLDSALLRPGRIDKIIKFDYARQKQIKEIYKAYMGVNYTDDNANEFVKAFQELNIKVVVAVFQEYLFKYLDDPDGALENIDEIKDLHTASTKGTAELYT